MTADHSRPWRLECWEMNLDTIEEEWRTWSTYVGEAKAVERRDKLIGKGYTARVVNTETGAVVAATPAPPTCTFCGGSHPAPYDGGCLL